MCGKAISNLYEQLDRWVQIDLGIGDGGVPEKCRQHRQPKQRVLARLIECRQRSGCKGMAEVMDTRRPALQGAHACTSGERLDRAQQGAACESLATSTNKERSSRPGFGRFTQSLFPVSSKHLHGGGMQRYQARFLKLALAKSGRLQLSRRPADSALSPRQYAGPSPTAGRGSSRRCEEAARSWR
jgi:hypothetical protein